MFRQSAWLLLSAALANGYAISPRDGPNLSPLAQEVLKAAGIDLSKPHVKPNKKVEEILAIGDSYTAGIGSNGKNQKHAAAGDCSRYDGAWPIQLGNMDIWNEVNDGTKPKITSGSCSGAKMAQLRDEQLKQGDPKDERTSPIGKPQLAVLTIGGNDVLFSSVVNDCIYRADFTKKMKGCDERLAEVNGIMDKPEFKRELMDTYADILKAGRDAQGADPAESFQIYVGGYVQFFNHDNPDCDDAYWNIFPQFTYIQWLTKDLRKQFNVMVEKLNGIIKDATHELESFGVFYVEDYQHDFVKRRYCEEIPKVWHSNDYQDSNKETGFWAWTSSWYIDNGEGNPADPPPPGVTGKNFSTKALEIMVPDAEARKTVSEQRPPWDINPKLNDYPDLMTAVKELGKDDPEIQGWLNDSWYRMFHPKASAYTYFANKFMDTIRAHRDPPPKAQAPAPGPSQPQYKKGTCGLHLTQYLHCGDDKSDYTCKVTIKDNDGKVISDVGEGPCNADSPLGANSKLPSVLVISSQHRGDYVQFAYGSQNWKSSDKQCSVGAMNDKLDLCWGNSGPTRHRDMDCSFPCD